MHGRGRGGRRREVEWPGESWLLRAVRSVHWGVLRAIVCSSLLALAGCGRTGFALDVCGDSVCTVGENCASCPGDCGFCGGCGDGICEEGVESCRSCAIDCGRCKGCGDHQCDGLETCTSCPEDCGACGTCGDG